MLPTYSKHTLRPSSALLVQVGRPVVVHAARSAAPYGDAKASFFRLVTAILRVQDH